MKITENKLRALIKSIIPVNASMEIKTDKFTYTDPHAQTFINAVGVERDGIYVMYKQGDESYQKSELQYFTLEVQVMVMCEIIDRLSA